MSSEKTFGGIEDKYTKRASSKVLLQSIPYDGTSTWGKGADEGFHAFMDAASNMELYDIETNSEAFKEGIHLLEEAPSFISPEEMYAYTYKNTVELLKEDKFLTFFGGEHSISIGLIQAHYEHFQNITVLQIDAHADLRPSYGGTKYNHACAVFDASKNTNLVQVGIRSMDESEREHMDFSKVVFGDEATRDNGWHERVINMLTDNVYITFDLDAFDPSIMPATGTPEPGGLLWYPTLEFLKKVFMRKNVVGFDLVELAPIKGLSAPQFLTAKLYYKMLAYKFFT
jgi:agmatinase